MTDKPTLEGLVCQGKLPEAIAQLKSLIETLKGEPYTNLIALSGRYSDNRAASDTNTAPKELTSIESNRIRATFLSILGDVREEIEEKINFFKPIPRAAKDRDTLRDFIETGLSRKYVDIKPFTEGHSFIYFSAKERHSDQEVMIMVMKTSDIEEIKKNSQLNRISQLKHRNLIQLLDVNFQTYPYYLITEMVSGVNLKVLLRNTGTLPLYNTKRILLVIGDVMDYLRQKKFSHSGIRPSKIIIDHEMEPEISPFDIHQVSDAKRLLSAFIEDCHYFAPEKLFEMDKPSSSDATDKASQFCLATLAYEMLTGEKLFSGENLSDIMLMRQRFFADSEFRKNHLAHPRIPTRVVAILKKMLAENPAKRYEDMGLALRDIGRIRVELDDKEEIVFASYRRCLSHSDNFPELFFKRLFDQDGMEALKPTTPGELTLFFQRFHIAVHLMFDIENTIASVEKTTRLSPLESNSHTEYGVLLNAFVETVSECDPRWNSRGVSEAWQHVKNRILDALNAYLPANDDPIEQIETQSPPVDAPDETASAEQVSQTDDNKEGAKNPEGSEEINTEVL
ncbi:MAG: protein kinase domain-containing protein [Saprospiraceae bacterium]